MGFSLETDRRAWPRQALAATVLATVVALLAASWSSWRGVRSAQDGLIRAQAEGFVHDVHERLRAQPGPPTDADAEAVLEQGRESGLRHVEVIGRDPRPLASAGDALDQSFLTDQGDAQGMTIRRVGDRVHVQAAPPPRPRRRGPWRPPAEEDERAPGEPVIVLEFEPLLAAGLEARATRSLLLGGLAGVVLLGGSLLTWRLQRSRDAAERALADQRRLADLGGMSALLAHEIRNPLASLKGHAQLLAEKLPDGESARKAERIVAEARRLEILAASLLDFVRSGRVEVAPSDPVALLREVADDSGAGRVVVDVRQCPETWLLDPARLRQALVNLVVNALQASPEGAAVDLSARLDGGRLVVAVRDRGTGLPAGLGSRIFEPFVTTRTSGTGLGLAVTRRIVEMHGGEVSARDHPEGGAVFELSLPERTGRS